jgi:subtilisin family serine protease
MKTLRHLAVLIASFTTCALTALAQASGSQVADQYIVELQPGASPAAVAARHGVGPVFVYSSALNGFAGRLPRGLLARLQGDPQVRSVTPDRVVSAIASSKPGGGGTTPPPAEVVPAGVSRIGAAPANKLGVTGAGVGVAIVDTGIDLGHADLIGNVSSLGYNAFTGGATGQDDNGHGTHVAGIVAAVDNDIGVVGVAPGATLYAVKVLDAAGSGSDAVVIAGLEWVASHAAQVSPPIRVVNMSLGRPGSIGDNAAFRTAVQRLAALGIAVVVAAGNDASLTVAQQVPAAYPETIAVASTTARSGVAGKVGKTTVSILGDVASYFTTDGGPTAAGVLGVSVSAPGEEQEDVQTGGFIASVGILSTARGGGTVRMSGTSMASPHAAGVAALLWQQANLGGVTLTAGDVRRKLQGGSTGIGALPKDSPTSGYTFDGVREGVLWAPGALATP